MAQFDMKIHIIEYQVTEGILGILSARALRGKLKKQCQNNQFVPDGISALQPHWLVSHTYCQWLVGQQKLAILYVKFSVIPFHLITFFMNKICCAPLYEWCILHGKPGGLFSFVATIIHGWAQDWLE